MEINGSTQKNPLSDGTTKLIDSADAQHITAAIQFQSAWTGKGAILIIPAITHTTAAWKTRLALQAECGVL